MPDTVEHVVTVDPDRTADDLIACRCTCGDRWTDFDEDEARTSIDMHYAGLDSTR